MATLLLLMTNYVGSNATVPMFNVWISLLELLSISACFLIFLVAWMRVDLPDQGRYVLVGCGFLGVGLLDLGHIMSFVGMPHYFTSNSLDKSHYFSFAARLLAALSFLMALAIGLRSWSARSQVAYGVLGGVAAYVVLTHVWLLAWPRVLPAIHLHEGGLTLLARAMESVLIVVYGGLVLGVWEVGRRKRDAGVAWVLAALVSMMGAQAFFVFYDTANDVAYLSAHLLKLLAYVFLYRVIVRSTIHAPYAALRASEAQLKAVVAALPDTVCEVDADGVVQAVHAIGREGGFVAARSFVGRRIADVLPGAQAATVMAALAQADQEGCARGIIVELDVAGVPRSFEISIARKAGRAQPAQFAVVSRDVTARLQDEAKLRKLEHAVEQSPSTIMITDVELRLEYANQAFTRSTGYTLEEAFGMTPKLLHSGKTPKQVYESLWATLSQGEAWRGEFVNRRKDGTEYLEAVLISPVKDSAGVVVNYLAVKDDITQQRRDQERLSKLLSFDAITGLPRRKLFARRLDAAMNVCDRNHGRIAFMAIDIDRFKRVNDTLGHKAGDALLVELARRLQFTPNGGAIAFRHSGGQFFVAVPLSLSNEAARYAERLQAELSLPVRVNGRELVVTVSIGIALYPSDGRDTDILMQHAEAALAEAKAAGSNSYRYFSPDMQQRSSRFLQLENALRGALAQHQLSIVYQPQVDIATRTVTAVEALLRWRHPELGQVSPAEFIPVAESSGQIVQIGEWVLRTASRQMAEWHALGLPRISVAVNLSLAQFRHSNLLPVVDEALRDSGLAPDRLELELTESIAMDDPDMAVRIVDQLRARGVGLAIDDFGTGYSSMSYLKRLDLHKLKIDKSFIDNVDRRGPDVAIVRAIIGVAQSLEMVVVAEGVETESQLEALRRLGCDKIQGYYFSAPRDAAGFAAYLDSGGKAATAEPAQSSQTAAHVLP